MNNVGIAFYIIGALVTLYVVAATWRSRDADARVRERSRERLPPRAPQP
jgi:hypothetical protein